MKEPQISNTTVQEAPQPTIVAETTPQEYNPFCGFSFVSIVSTSTHFCNNCGSTATGLAKEWDNGQVVWSKYACERCYYAVVATSRANKNGDDLSNSSTSS